jgi:hypothetical protein
MAITIEDSDGSYFKFGVEDNGKWVLEYKDGTEKEKLKWNDYW